MWMRSWFLLLLTSGALVACGDEGDPGGPDAGEGDAGAREVAASLAGNADGVAGNAPLPRGAAPRSVTLLTGDRVLVDKGGQFTIEPASGRGGVSFHTYRAGQHQYVVPGDAAPLVATGQLDRRLFDLTLLLELDYDDAHRSDVPLIVSHGRPGRRAAESAMVAAGARVTRPFTSLHGAAVRAPKATAAAWWSMIAGPTPGKSGLAAGGVGKIWLDGKRRLLLDHSTLQIAAPAAWQAGYTGRGVTVAVLDTGIDATHPDFAGRITEARSFVEESPDATDEVGHGTHVASILAGSGAGEDGRYRGVAPDADLLIGKVCVEGFCPESAILAGMEWAAASGAAIVNLSLGGEDTPERDPLEESIDILSARHGTLFVVAAGNQGGCGGGDGLRVGSPSTADAALSVGAVDSEDELADFSCRGPRIGDSAIKPDLTAPGVAIAAARAPGTPAGDRDPVGELYARLSGTSMATPHAAGVAALLAQRHPDWRGEQLKAAMIASARPHPERNAFEQGAGRVDAARALAQIVTTSPASLSFGLSTWPHDDDEPIARTVLFRNSGPTPVILELELEVSDPGGAPAPEGMFAVAPRQVEVPAGGEASVTVTADTRVAGPVGQFTGALLGTAGDQTVRTPIAVDREGENYELRLASLDRDGQPSFDFVFLVNLLTQEFIEVMPSEGGALLRLPRGQYMVTGFQDRWDGELLVYTALLVQPLLDLDRDRSISLDARLARPVQMTVPRQSARWVVQSAAFARSTADGWTGAATQMSSYRHPHSTAILYTAQLGPKVPESELGSMISGIWAEPAAGEGEGFEDSPYQYNLAFTEVGRFPTGFSRRIRQDELATVHARYSAHAPDMIGLVIPNGRTAGSIPALSQLSSPGARIPYRLPMSRTEYFLAENIVWEPRFHEETEPFVTVTRQLAPLVTYQAGRHYHARWNAAVLGPSLPSWQSTGPGDPPGPAEWVTRTGDELRHDLPFLYSDEADHQGTSVVESGESRLYRDGELIGQSPDPGSGTYDLPAGLATYRLEVESIRGEPFRLSTRVSLAWTFRSEHVAGDEPARLPVMAVRFAPVLDEHNRAPAGRPFAIPLAVTRQAGAPSAPLSRLTVQASYDGGQSWQAALVLRLGDHGVALVHHPDGPGGVSLRATAVDKSGNAVEQTIVDSYRLGD